MRGGFTVRSGFYYFSAILSFGSLSAHAENLHLTLLHTNDLHSHFRSERDPLKRGGLARIKTAIDQIRANTPTTLLVDGGDWSEGHIYYTEGAGRESLRLMDHLGYDAAVVGNHDWLNGPETLLRAYAEANSRMALLAANVSSPDSRMLRRFQDRIAPYTIKEVGGIRVAMIGLLTYEFIYDRYLKPINITEPFALVRDLSARLRREQRADIVIAISHNSVRLNQKLLSDCPELDLVVGAHDHVKLTRPVVVERPGRAPGWVVETGSWGRYLGRVDIEVEPQTRQVSLKNYGLTQIDFTIPEDQTTVAMIEQLEAVIEQKRGPIFHDHVADSEVDLNRQGLESPIGNFATDAYRQATHADLAIDQINFIYGDIRPGALRSVDFFNANPGVYNPTTERSWTLKTLPMTGRTLTWLLNIFLSSRQLSQRGGMNLSGIQIEFAPIFDKSTTPVPFGHPLIDLQEALSDQFRRRSPILRKVSIQGQPLDEQRTYQVAAGGGVVEAFEFLNATLPGAVPLDQVRDTGLEDWRVMADYARSISPIQSRKIEMGNRLRTTAPDLGILNEDIEIEPLRRTSTSIEARIAVRVKNYGSTPSSPDASLHLFTPSRGINEATESEFREAFVSHSVPALQPGESATLYWENAVIPADHGIYPFSVDVWEESGAEINTENNRVTKYYRSFF